MTKKNIDSARASTLAEYEAMRDTLNALDLDELNVNIAETILREIETLIAKDQLMTVDGRISAIYNLILSSLDEE